MADDSIADGLAPDAGASASVAATSMTAPIPPAGGSSAAPATPPAPPEAESVMSLVDHLGELRSRIFRVVLAMGLLTDLPIIGLAALADRKSVVKGKSVDLGGRRIITKKMTGADASGTRAWRPWAGVAT